MDCARPVRPFRRHARRRAALLLSLCLAVPGSAAGKAIVQARYAEPVARYGHYALGRPHEYATLAVVTDTGRRVALTLPEDEVFEDLVPRRVRFAGRDADELLVVVSHRSQGARLAVVGLDDHGLAFAARSEPIGTPMRWLNPVGVADLDGDGTSEVAAVVTPHLDGVLKVYRRAGSALREIAARRGYSNHVYGSSELSLSAIVRFAGQMRLVVPDATRRSLRVVALERDRLIERGRCPLPGAALGPLRATRTGEVAIGMDDGEYRLLLALCSR